ncbi:hypothetical protein [Rubritalea halochordaticola]|uniref:hypothetical protein n=1 Tax=Rubritalea halochordaticola TaxID=714537 RepID=UPI0031FD8C14
MLFNNPEFIQYIANHFVGVASDDVAYNHLSDAAKAKGEYRFLHQSLADGGARIHQGVYAVTPSGRFLAKIDTGWPTYDPVKSLENLKKAKVKYDGLKRENRLKGTPLSERDRSYKAREANRNVKGVKLVTYARHYPFKEMELFDARHPQYSKRDSLWFSADEAKGLLPSTLTLGSRAALSVPVAERLLLHGHLMFGCPAWWKEHIKKADIQVQVIKLEGDLVYLTYEGAIQMEANSQWNQSGYSGKLIGRAVWNKQNESFQSLEWVSLGSRSLHELKSNLHRGTTKTTSVASYIRLANSPHEKQLLPHKWDEYPKAVKSSN